MRVYEELRRAVKAAAPDRLGEVATAVWQAYAAAGLTDEQAEELDGLVNARRGAARAAPLKVQPLAVVTTQLAPAAAPSTRGEGASPSTAHHRTGSRPRSAESMARRRRWAAAGYLPPKLAQAFTAGEQAVLAVVALEVGKRGACSLALGHIAALAGVSETTAKRALRQAKLVGLISIAERRLSRWRNDTNVIRVVSAEWAAWLRLRLPRANHAGLQVDGGQSVPGTKTGSFRRTASGQRKPGQGRAAGPGRPRGNTKRKADA